MKAKKINKKLSLNKQTVAHLEKIEMDDAKGGCHNITAIIYSKVVNCDSVEYCLAKFPTGTCNR
jgi:natural product precursor